MNDIDEKYMRRCLQLAANGKYTAAPNPMVGAVIVYKDQIIGEGYHIQCGGPHAEVNAIRSVKHPELLKEATIYVSLEPCSHYGKTPPCADLIIEKQIPRIVIGCKDPFPQVAGRGIQKLIDAGREVKVGVLEEECLALNQRFISFNIRHRPYIMLKWAQSADGFIDVARTGGSPVVLSTPYTSILVHQRRSECNGILVGTRTALLDNPSLTTRHWYGKQPVRMVIDREGKLLPNLHLFDQQVPTLVFTSIDKPSLPNLEFIRLDFSTAILPQLLDELYKRKIQTLMVEGGSYLLQSFIDAQLWDEICIEHAAIELKDGVSAPVVPPHCKHNTTMHFNTTIEQIFPL